jgi:hypothetical protein
MGIRGRVFGRGGQGEMGVSGVQVLLSLLWTHEWKRRVLWAMSCELSLRATKDEQ